MGECKEQECLRDLLSVLEKNVDSIGETYKRIRNKLNGDSPEECETNSELTRCQVGILDTVKILVRTSGQISILLQEEQLKL